MPRVVDHQQRRAEIVHAVWQLIARRGIAGVTLRAVAAEAEISMGRVQHYFSSREELVLHGCRMMLDGAQEALARNTDDLTPWQELCVLVRHSIPQTPEFAVGTIVWNAYIALAVDSPAIADLVRRAHRDGVERARDLLVAAQADGTVRDDLDPRRTGQRLLALSEGYGVRVLAGSLDAAEALDVVDAELRGLLDANGTSAER
ncbi:TetR/AcrR family transcriptional regulator [Microlunatus soli]|uniref:DNA-binding transcriptional regulator, AcrR family n=1 Tax=Microlunatus soli TaxID=630515 RepID=A0A1H1ZID0_9ACTN|nr:TetR/AcrR family transcriptional regulator [Microlunatus soli]SDT33232.1 DNA-binding transcriptional regulator, AcrR family [Microlunatus soli]